MPDKKKNNIPTNDNEPEDVLTSEDYHSQMQNVDEFQSEDELIDYIKNNAKQAFEASLEKSIEEARDSGQPFDLNYTEKAVPVIPKPCTIDTQPNGQEKPVPLSPGERPTDDTAIVYFALVPTKVDGKLKTKNPREFNPMTAPRDEIWIPSKVEKNDLGQETATALGPTDNLFADNVKLVCYKEKPLYENDKKTLKIAKSTDTEFMALFDENAPEAFQMFAQPIKDIVRNYERKHTIKTASFTETIKENPNKKAIDAILKFCKFPEWENKELSNKDKQYWQNSVKDEKTREFLIKNNIVPNKNKILNTTLIKVIKTAIAKKALKIEEKEKEIVR